ncbi:MAG: energy-coupling factor transporter ATPase [Ruminococcaceae bacterium]|nr:energy-coupling factor transporter ATPase [Oscillospiraceae bacterium]
MGELTLKNVTYVYGAETPFEKAALHDVNVSFNSGVITGLIGHTGSGKSTLVQLLNGLLKPTSGNIYLNGCDIWENPKDITSVRYKVGLVMQYPEYQLFEETVRKDIAYGPTNMGLEPEEVEKRVRESAFFCGISEDLFDKSPFDLSGGQKRRVAIAGVMAMKPSVLILDEPAAGLDPIGREEILGGIRTFQKQTNTTVIIVSHSMEDMAVYCDEIVVMNKSEVYMKGPTAEIFAKADKLVEVGLDVPQITHLFKKMKDMGIDVPENVFTVEEARKVIVSLLN